MSRCGLPVHLFGCLLGGLVLGVLQPAPAAAADLLAWLRVERTSHTAEYLCGAQPSLSAPTTVSTNPGGLLPNRRQPTAPGTPSFAWGYFGAAPRGVRFTHEDDYDGEYSWWFQQRQ